MLQKRIFIDIIIFVVIVLLLLVIIPIISSILKNLITLQILIVIAGGLALGYLVRRIRKKFRE